MKEINLPCYGITIRLEREPTGENSGCGTITTGLKDTNEPQFNAAIDGIESLILAHACAGVDVESPAYIEGIETAVDAIFNHCSSAKPKVVIDVSGGVVQAVFTDADVDVMLVDWDADGCSPDDDNIVEADGKYVHAVHYPTDAMNAMPKDTAEAVEKAH